MSRIFGADGLGEYSYALNISSYFMTFAMLGFNNYGSKVIAASKHDRSKLEKTYSSVRKLQIITSMFSLMVYLIGVCLLCNSSNRIMFLIQSLWIVDCFLNVNWFFWGLEEVKLTVTRNFIIKIITLSGIFLLIKSKSDLLLYAFILVIGTLCSDLYLLLKTRKYLNGVKTTYMDALQHFVPCLWLFVPIVAITFYQQIDKTMLGVLSTYDQVGYYYNTDKVVNIPLGIIAGFGTVSLPRIVSLIAQKKIDEYIGLVSKSVSLIMFMCSAIVFGLMTISEHFVPLFFGRGFEECIILISVLAFAIYLKSISTIVVNQILIPNNMEKHYVISVFLGAILNCVVNYYLILSYGALGAVAATLLSELLVCVIQIALCRRNIPVFKLIIKNSVYVAVGIVMLIGTKLIVSQLGFNSLFVFTIVDIVIGAFLYIGICLIYWFIAKDELFYPIISNMLLNIKKRMIHPASGIRNGK